MSLTASPPVVDHSGIRGQVTVDHHTGTRTVHAREAATYINQGYRVQDRWGFDLTLSQRRNGTWAVVRGEDALGSFTARVNQVTRERAQGRDDSGRPIGLSDRPLTDYEAGREHPQDCGILNCDHPVHFGGTKDGKLVWGQMPEKRGDKEGKGGEDQERTSKGEV